MFLTCVKYAFAVLLGICFLVIIAVGVGNCYNICDFGVNYVQFAVLVAFMLLLAANEAFQVACLGLQQMKYSDIGRTYSRAADVYILLFPRGFDAAVKRVEKNDNAEPELVRRPPVILRSISQDSLSTAGGYSLGAFHSVMAPWSVDKPIKTGETKTNTSASLPQITSPSDLEESHSPIKRLLIGQSFLVVLCSFIISNVTTFPNFPTVFHIPEALMNVFFRSGLPGAYLTICCSQLLPSILAKEYPLQVLEIPGIYWIVRLALAIEQVGVVEFTYASVTFVTFVSSHAFCGLANGLHSLIVCILQEKEEEHVNVCSESEEAVGNDWDEGSGDCDLESYIHTVASGTAPDASDNDSDSGDNCNTGGVAMTGIKMLFSASLVLSSVVFVFFSVGLGYSSFSGPVSTQFGLLVIILVVIFYCEGLKVAVVRTAYLNADSAQLERHPIAKRLLSVIWRSGNGRSVRGADNTAPRTSSSCSAVRETRDGNKLTAGHACGENEGEPDSDSDSDSADDGVKRFLLGRQLIVVPLGFLVAQITHFNGFPKQHLSSAMYFILVSLGLPGMLTLLVFSQLTPQLVAESSPIVFLEKRGCYVLVHAALFLEKAGLANLSWVLYALSENLCCGSKELKETE